MYDKTGLAPKLLIKIRHPRVKNIRCIIFVQEKQWHLRLIISVHASVRKSGEGSRKKNIFAVKAQMH